MSTSVPQHGENNNHCHDEEKYIKRKSQRRPFANLSSNTPSKKPSGKVLQSTAQPLKPLQRSASAPFVPSPTKEVQPHQALIATGLPRSIFRSNYTSLEMEDMWTLKRASPVFDLEDEDGEESLESPSKRVRTFFIPFPEERDTESSSRQRLPWDCKIREDENGFHLEL